MLQFFRKRGTSYPPHSCEESYQNCPELIKSRCNLHKRVGARGAGGGGEEKDKSAGGNSKYELMVTLAVIIFALWRLHIEIHEGVSTFLGFDTSISYCKSEKPMKKLYESEMHP